MRQFVLDLDPVARRYYRETEDPIERVEVSRWLRFRAALGQLERIEPDRLRELVQSIPKEGLWINSYYHHLTYPRLAAWEEDGLTYLHIDAHHDRARFPPDPRNKLSNASFVDAIDRLPHVDSVVMIGTYHPDNACSMDQGALVAGEELPTIKGPVYLSLDADVLAPELFATEYCQGVLGMDRLTEIIEAYRDQLVAADVMGLDWDHPDQNYVVYDRIRELF